MNTNRRHFFTRLGTLSAGILASAKSLVSQVKRTEPAGQTSPPAMDHSRHMQHTGPAVAAKMPGTVSAGSVLPVMTPDVPKLPFKLVNGVKEFHLIAEVVKTEFMPGRPVTAWGYNGGIPGPTIEVDEGDHVRVIFDNHLPEPTSIHWHGFEIPVEMDGVPGITQDPVMPGQRYVYEFTLHQNGTFFYHSHMPMQQMMGMIGLFIMHPRKPAEPKVDRDFGIVLQEWAILPNNSIPNTMAMEFNWLTMNGKAGPATTPMLVKIGERVRIRLVNLGMDHHPIHLHGVQFVVTGSEGGRQPQSTWAPGNTVVVGVAQARDIEFDAKYPGDWMLHCHMPHHNMNQMTSMVGPVMSMGHGLEAGGGMPEGMGIVRSGNALSESLGPALGRGLGVGADGDRATSNLVAAQQGHEGHQAHGAKDPVMEMYPKDDPEKKKVPGYPQDMWMVMDEMFKDKPETFGLRRGWTASMTGMMTLVRVLSPEKYDEIMALVTKKTARTPHMLRGKAEAISESAGTLTVSHGKVEGWMDAMTMAYSVDKPEVLKKIKVGDQIKATVYSGEYKLYDVEVVPAAEQKQ